MNKFIASTDLNEKIQNLLFEKLGIEYAFLNSFYNFIQSIYSETNAENKLIEYLTINDLSNIDIESKNKKCSYGIDLPVWFIDENENKTKKKIMILAMDPLRNKQNNGTESNQISFNSPFSIHQKTKNNYYPSIKQLSEKYDVYITDVFKLFFRNQENQNSVSNQDEKFIRLDIHTELLQKEIEIFKPDIILCLGKHPINGLSKIDKSIVPNSTIVSELKNYNFTNIPTFAIPHASGVASKWAKIFMVSKNNSEYNSQTYILDALNLIENQLNKTIS